MAIATPTNADLPSSVLLPGVYLKLNLQGGGSGLNSPSKKVLLIGNKLAAGSQAQDTVVQVSQQGDANTFFGRGSDLARMYAAAVSQVGPGACDVYCLPVVEPAAGTAATHLIAIAGTATAAGSISATVCGYTATVAIANGDTSTTVASSLAAQLNLIKDLPVTSAASSGTVTMTYVHKGLVGNDLPRIVNIVGATGITASPGTLTYATTAVGAGSTTISIGGTTISATIANADTATIIGASAATAINAGGYPVTASAATGVVTLLYANDRVVHRINAAIVTTTGTTVTVACGVLGAGAPALTTALTNLQPAQAYPVWATSLNDNGNAVVTLGAAGGSFHGGTSGAGCSIGAIKTHIATYADGYNQKGQTVMFGATEALALSGGYQTGTGVQTTSDAGEARFAEVWFPDHPQQALELVARAAALRISQDYKPKNYAGAVLSTKSPIPLAAPHRVVRPGPADLNSAMLTYYMTPLVFDEASATHKILRDRTTDASSDQRLWSWGTVDVSDYIRSDLNGFLSSLFSGKSFKSGVQPPRTPNVVTTRSIQDAVAERFRSYDSIDFVDDIDSIVKGITAAQDSIVPNRVNIFVPFRVPVALYQIAGNLTLS